MEELALGDAASVTLLPGGGAAKAERAVSGDDRDDSAGVIDFANVLRNGATSMLNG